MEGDDHSCDASSAVEKRLSTPSTSSACSLYFQPVQQTPFYIRASNLKHQQQQYIDRIDSGYAADQDVFELNKVGHYHLDTRLAQDIQYVDQLYYTNSRSRQQKRITNASNLMADIVGASHDHGDDDITIGTKLTFAAAALASQDSSMRDICLSRRSLISVSPNIGLLACIRKLNL
jgi:endoglucanase Acf2